MSGKEFQEIKDFIARLVSHVLFEYNGKECGIDPFSHQEFDMWYGDKAMKATSVDEVFTSPFFDGKCLNEIADEIENVDY